MAGVVRRFRDYRSEGHLWVTVSSGSYYPDVLPLARELYEPVLVMFGRLLERAQSSKNLFIMISEMPDPWMRIQLARVFRKYVSPETPVEMLKKKRDAAMICEQFGDGFRDHGLVLESFRRRPMPDETLCALLWEYKDRGKKGYDLTERLFVMLREQFPTLRFDGPERAGRDIFLGDVLPDYTNSDRPVDFLIYDDRDVLAVGLARYDSDRGGAQQLDRTGQYRDCAHEILSYAEAQGHRTKVIFLNDGPGLLLGAMWDKYSEIEDRYPGRVIVTTLRMVPERLTLDWLTS